MTNDKILDGSKLKALARWPRNVAQIMIFVPERNCGQPAFPPFPTMFCSFWKHHFFFFNTFISLAVFGENPRYCYSLGIFGGGIVVMRKLWHFVISLLLLKIFTYNLEYVFTIQRAIHTIKGDNSKCIFFFRIMPLTFYPLSSTPQPSAGTHIQCSCFCLLVLKFWCLLKGFNLF